MNKTIGLFALLIIILYSPFCKSKSKQAIIEFEKDSVNIGSVKLGDSILLNLKFFNKGDGILHINNIGYSCGCTNGKILKRDILPGESGSISLVYKNDNDNEIISKAVIIENNSNTPFKVIRLIGNARF